jgi:hypothetical protein
MLDAGTVKAYLTQLYKDSGPVALNALLPAEFHMYRGGRAGEHPLAEGKCFVDDWDLFLRTVRDPENLFVILVGALTLLVVFDRM